MWKDTLPALFIVVINLGNKRIPSGGSSSIMQGEERGYQVRDVEFKCKVDCLLDL